MELEPWEEAANELMEAITASGKKPTWPDLVRAIQTKEEWLVYRFDRNILDGLEPTDFDPQDPSRLGDAIRRAALHKYSFEHSADVSTPFLCYQAWVDGAIKCKSIHVASGEVVDDTYLDVHFHRKARCRGWRPLDEKVPFERLSPRTEVGFRGSFVFV